MRVIKQRNRRADGLEIQKADGIFKLAEKGRERGAVNVRFAREQGGAARAKDKSLPKWTGKAGKPLPNTVATEKHIHEVFVRSLLAQKNRAEVRKWLESGGKAVRSLGRFKRKADALTFVEALYKAGATEVIAPDIYASKTGDQFADCILVKLPGNAAKRKVVRKVCAQLSKRKLGAFQPDKDIGETHLYLLLA